MAYRRKPYRIKRSVKFVLWSFIALIVFTVANIYFNRPATGTIIKPSLADEPNAAEESKKNVITTKYFSLIYDGELDTVSNLSSDNPGALEVYRIARSDVSGRRKFVITIKDLPAGGMSEESSYKLRSISPDEYRESNQTHGKVPYVVMQKLDGTELTAFSVDGDKLAMLAYTIDAPSDNIVADASELLASFSWNR